MLQNWLLLGEDFGRKGFFYIQNCYFWSVSDERISVVYAEYVEFE